MKISPNNFSFSKIMCNLFGHTFKVSKNVTHHIHEYRCAKCGLEMTDNADGFLSRLTPKFKETNNYIAKIYKRRRLRKSQFAKAS